ncbi:MAG: sigma factor-like helix-turn-helix DNA-binding protein, partial [Minisyncoccia bacterium]
MISANKLVNKFIEVLNKRQKEIILKRFGLDSEQKTLSSLGKQFGVTRERVRQIQNNALKLIKEKNQNNLDYKN